MNIRKIHLISLAMLLLSLILVSCGGKALDPTPANEKQGPGIFSGESGKFRVIGKPNLEETDQKKNSE
jgi:hypothetical protein